MHEGFALLSTDDPGAAAVDELVAGVLDSIAIDHRILFNLPSGGLLAEFIRACWDRAQPIALAKPTMTEDNLQVVIREFDPNVIVGLTSSLELSVRTVARPDHPTPVGVGSVTVFTSGSTGPPKGVVLPRSSIRGNAEKTAKLHRITPQRPHATCLELFHVNALIMSLVGTHLTGSQLVLGPAGDPAAYFSAIHQHGARTASVNPVRLRAIVDASPAWPESLDYLITAAGPLSQSLARAFHSRYGPRLRQGYGLSEAVNFSFVMPEVAGMDFIEHYLDRRPPVGVPLPGTEYVIENGELFIRTDDRMAGYLGSSSPSPIDASGWLRTGDGALERDGFVVLRGRSVDALCTSATTRVFPADVEDAIPLQRLVRDSAAVAIRGLKGDRDGVALYCDQSWDVKLWSSLEKTFPTLDLLRTDRLAVSASGKVDRRTMSEEAGRLVGAIHRTLTLPTPGPSEKVMPIAEAQKLAGILFDSYGLARESQASTGSFAITVEGDDLLVGADDSLWLLVAGPLGLARASEAIATADFNHRHALLVIASPARGVERSLLMHAWSAANLREKTCAVIQIETGTFTALWGTAR